MVCGQNGRNFVAKTTCLTGHILMHRVIIGLKVEDIRIIDHKDGNGLNNQKVNLRVCNNQQNSFNKLKSAGLSSIYKGVHWSKARQTWICSIKDNREGIYLGGFENEKAAALAYNQKAMELFGEFAKLNEVK